MKKAISLVLSVFLFFSFCLIPAQAAENSDVIRTNLINQACIIFPEYADRILNDRVDDSTSTYINRGQQREILIQETRNISENETLTYTEYTGNLVVLSSASYYDRVTVPSHEWISGTLYRISCDLQATSNLSPNVFLAHSIVYEDSNETYATIISRGDLTEATTSPNAFAQYQTTETYNSPAYSSYFATFNFNDGSSEMVVVSIYRQDHTLWSSTRVLYD